MFIAQCKTVGFFNITPFSNLFSPLPPSQSPSMPGTWVAQGNVSPHWEKSYDFLPQPQMPPRQIPSLSTSLSLFFIPYFLNTAQEEALEGQKSLVHKSPRSLPGERNLMAGYFNILSKPPNPEQWAEPLCECDRLQDNESTVQLPLLLMFLHSLREAKQHPSPHAQNEPLKC